MPVQFQPTLLEWAWEDNPIRAVTQFEMGVLESLGLLKIDYLGLSTLTVMARACGHDHLAQFTSTDLATWNREMAHLAGQ